LKVTILSQPLASHTFRNIGADEGTSAFSERSRCGPSFLKTIARTWFGNIACTSRKHFSMLATDVACGDLVPTLYLMTNAATRHAAATTIPAAQPRDSQAQRTSSSSRTGDVRAMRVASFGNSSQYDAGGSGTLALRNSSSNCRLFIVPPLQVAQ